MTLFNQKKRYGHLVDPLITDADSIEIVVTKDGYKIPLRPTQHDADDWDGDEQALSMGFWIEDDMTLIPMIPRPFIPPHQHIFA